MARPRTIRIGTRGSKLARWQSDWVAERLRRLGVAAEVVEIATAGDLDQRGPVVDLGGRGVFTKEIQSAVLAGEVDVAVHSLKDLPTEPVAGLVLAATSERESPVDALVANVAGSLAELPSGARVGTGSARRRAQLLHLRGDLDVVGIRGNVDTRLRKLDAGDYDAVVLAAAGLMRLGCGDRIVERLEPPRMLPAPGQGAMAVECRAGDADVREMVSQLDDPAARLATTAERSVLAALHGGCSAPVAAWGRLAGTALNLDALVASLDGVRVLRASATAEISLGGGDAAIAAADELGWRVANDLAGQGAAEIIAESRRL